MASSLIDLAEVIGAEVMGDGSAIVSSAATLDEAGPSQISFLANPKYARQLETTRATAVIVGAAVKPPDAGRVALLRTKDPYLAFTRAVIQLHGFRRHPHEGIHPKAHVDPSAAVGEGTVIYPFAFVGPRARIGRDCILYPNVTVYDDCVLGDRVTLHAGTSVGHDGFGYASARGSDGVIRHNKIPQIGNVVIEDDVELGANCSIDRATLGSTIIGAGTKFSDNIAIGHGSKLGAHGLLVAQVGIAGSVTIGHHVTMAGQVGVAGHLKIGDGVTIGAQSGVVGDIPDGATVIGSPGMPASLARRVYTLFQKLPELAERVKQLELRDRTAPGKEAAASDEEPGIG